jgi:hypothetical protein
LQLEVEVEVEVGRGGMWRCLTMYNFQTINLVDNNLATPLKCGGGGGGGGECGNV